VEEETGLGSRGWNCSWILNNRDVEELRLKSGKGKGGEEGMSAGSRRRKPP